MVRSWRFWEPHHATCIFTAGPVAAPAAWVAAGVVSVAAPAVVVPEAAASASGLAAAGPASVSGPVAPVSGLAAGAGAVAPAAFPPVPVVPPLPQAATKKLRTTSSGTNILRTFIVLPPCVKPPYTSPCVATIPLSTMISEQATNEDSDIGRRSREARDLSPRYRHLYGSRSIRVDRGTMPIATNAPPPLSKPNS